MGQRYYGAKILSYAYLFLLICIYVSVYIFINNISKEDLHIQNLTLIIITGFIGTHSKSFYESMLYMIYNFETNRIPKKINKLMLKCFSIANTLTLFLFSLFIVNVLKGQVNIFVLISINTLPFLLYIIALFFKASDSED